MDLKEEEIKIMLDDLELDQVEIRGLIVEDGKAIPDMGATIGAISCCSCCST